MTWFSALLATACLAAGLVHVLRLVAVRGDTAAGTAHAVMALGMAAMFAPAADPVPAPVWAVLFGATGAWAAAAAARAGAGEVVHHVVGSAAMLFMLLPGHSHAPGSGGSAHAGHVGQGTGVTSVAAIALAGWSAWHVMRCADRWCAARAAAPIAARAAAPVTAARAAAPVTAAPVTAAQATGEPGVGAGAGACVDPDRAVDRAATGAAPDRAAAGAAPERSAPRAAPDQVPGPVPDPVAGGSVPAVPEPGGSGRSGSGPGGSAPGATRVADARHVPARPPLPAPLVEAAHVAVAAATTVMLLAMI